MAFYKGAARRLNTDDILKVADSLKVEEAALRAVQEVEARGTGYDSQGRVIALYEKHIAYRYSSGNVRTNLIRADLAAPTWTSDYKTPAYTRIDKAIPIAGDEVTALATSWGLGQIMGFNHKAAGYDSAVAMVKDFADSEYAQLQGMANFIKANPAMHKAMKDKDWMTFARLYNGAGYAKNEYHIKLASAYNRWVNRKDPVSDTNAILRKGSRGPAVTAWQQTLNKAGFPVSTDGDFGSGTEAATKQFQTFLKVTADGVVGPGTRSAAEAYLTQSPKPEPAPVTPEPQPEAKLGVEDYLKLIEASVAQVRTLLKDK